MSYPALFDSSLNLTKNNSNFCIANYFQLDHLISSFQYHSSDKNKLQRVDRSVHDGPVTIALTADTLSLGVCIFALASRSSFQLRCLRNGILFWVRQILQTVTLVASFSILLSVAIIIGFMLAVYKACVQVYLRRTLLCGADAVWALDANQTKSKEVVTVLMTLEGKLSLIELKQIVQQRILPASRKLHFSRIYSVLGYFFWEPKAVDIAARVRVMEGCMEGEETTEDELRARVSNISNKPLPEFHCAGWEVLLGPRLPSHHTAIIFRVHHSVGDGTALCKMLVSAVADPQPQNSRTRFITTRNRHFKKSSVFERVRDATAGFAAQLSPADESPLHGANLSGEKQVYWRGSERLMQAARRVHAATGASFTAGLVAALTGALADHVDARGFATEHAPFTLVVPARMPGQLTETIFLELDNSFSFALVRTLLPSAKSSALERVQAVDAALRAASQPITLVLNSWALRMAGALLPQPLARKVLHSGQCTAVMSNLPGPTSPISLAGHNVSDFAFFVPHRGTTGVGASALSYAGKLTLALAIDAALLTGPDDTLHLTCAWEQHLLQLESTLTS